MTAVMNNHVRFCILKYGCEFGHSQQRGRHERYGSDPNCCIERQDEFGIWIPEKSKSITRPETLGIQGVTEPLSNAMKLPITHSLAVTHKRWCLRVQTCCKWQAFG